MEFTTMFLVAFGGGDGAILRYFIAHVGQSFTSTSFPLGTLIVNILGCTLIGLISAMLIGPFRNTVKCFGSFSLSECSAASRHIQVSHWIPSS
jgi:fluoride ion exporter CrcB/FEX